MSPTQANSSPATALVIGATGDFGDHMTTVLLARGWRVKALNRSATEIRRATSASTGVLRDRNSVTTG